MNDPNPVPKTVMNVSANTQVSAVAAFVAAAIIWYLGEKGTHFPAGFEALMAGAFSAVAGYMADIVKAIVARLTR